MCIISPALANQVIQMVQQVGNILTDPTAIHQITAKSSTDFVTNVDLYVQNTLRDQLKKLTPDVQFMGEEGETSLLDPTAPVWILDPVDGTTNLIHHFQHSAISLALAKGGQTVFGVVYHPYTAECFTAYRTKGAFRNGHPIHVSRIASLQDSLLSVGTVPGRRELAEKSFAKMWQLYHLCQDIRRTGCASLDLCWIACGRLDGYLELFLQPWDYAAGLLLVQEAGGKVTTPDGACLSLTQGGPLLASNGLLHHELIQQWKRG